MKAYSLQEIKLELQELPPTILSDLCLSLARYKMENKQYLGYLLFKAQDPNEFVAGIKVETDEYFVQFKTQKNLYHLKKNLRKVLRILNRYCQYMGNKALTAEVLIYFCLKIKQADIPVKENERLSNLWRSTEKKIRQLVSTVEEEDMRVDLLNELQLVFNDSK
jgi:hypothetical protein